MICLVNREKLTKFTLGQKLEIVEVNLLSEESADMVIERIAALFSLRGGSYHMRFWVGGSPMSRGHLHAEALISKGNIQINDGE